MGFPFLPSLFILFFYFFTLYNLITFLWGCKTGATPLLEVRGSLVQGGLGRRRRDCRKDAAGGLAAGHRGEPAGIWGGPWRGPPGAEHTE